MTAWPGANVPTPGNAVVPEAVSVMDPALFVTRIDRSSLIPPGATATPV